MAKVCPPLAHAPWRSPSHGYTEGGTCRLPPLPAIPANEGLSMLSSNKMVVVKVDPTFTSSDLFTPFGPARATLPSIAEFVRPTYGHDSTWGSPTKECGGVEGTSRGHKHIGTGCINFLAPPQPRTVTALHSSQCRPSDQILPKPLVTDQVINKQMQHDLPCQDKYMSHHSKFSVFPSHLPTNDKNSTEETEAPSVLTPETMRALSNIHTYLYSQSTYKTDYQTKSQSASGSKEEGGCEPEDEVCPSNESLEGQFQGEGECFLDEISTCPCDNEIKQDDKENHITLLPGHVIITHVTQLPDHFRRIRTKYTRNPGSLLPCEIPSHLLRKPSLLLPHVNQEGVVLLREGMVSGNDDSSEKESKGFHKLLPLSNDTKHLDTNSQQAAMFPEVPCKSCALPPVTGGPPSPLTPSQATPLTASQTTAMDRLGPVGFKTQAHARYHTLHPDSVPDLRASHVLNKKVWFHGYHASVFRGC